jgi:hypothetical protein
MQTVAIDHRSIRLPPLFRAEIDTIGKFLVYLPCNIAPVK